MVLKTLQVMGPLHGYGIARRIEQMVEGALALNQGTIYPALLRLEQKGWIVSEWARARPIGVRGSTRLRARPEAARGRSGHVGTCRRDGEPPAGGIV
jgi:DNA-binding PadR family transcriptional regulator